MNKAISFSAITATVVIAGTTLGSAPAQALSIEPGSSFQINSLSNIKITTTGIDFGNNGAAGAPVTLSDVLLADGVTSDPGWSTNRGASGVAADILFNIPQTSFLTFTLLDPAGSPLTFDFLAPFGTTVSTAPGSNDTFTLSFATKIRNALTGTIVGDGSLTAQVKDGFVVGNNQGVSSFSVSVTAVPTPALLPGLIGLGVGMLRKRKAEATAKAQA
ncbi:MAG: PTPA-CTERM sorting domain-containing protein [Oscillatoriales cyanobacterium C42_A2020_001]|nr:PTPA-CTERM sorting domain-containing protein [Leptolyngbyaceae cyanobacterium C42_A2020_001]